MQSDFFVSAIYLAVVFSCAAAGFREDSVNIHNRFRRTHKSRPLVQSYTLNVAAQNWASILASSDSLEFQRSNGPYGENLYKTSSKTISNSQVVIDAINMWYNEVSKYDYNNPGFTIETGHFTQVVWKNSRTVGIGIGRAPSGTIVCATYDPPGNFQGRFPANVEKP